MTKPVFGMLEAYSGRFQMLYFIVICNWLRVHVIANVPWNLLTAVVAHALVQPDAVNTCSS